MKILLVGGGITSAVTGTCLRRMFPDCTMEMWDKARGTGGRMTTSRSPVNSSCTADLGAQYITTTEDYIKSNFDIYGDLLSEGVLEPLKCNVIGMRPQGNNRNFVLPKGTGFLVKNFFKKAQLNDTKFHHHVATINRENDKWIVETKTGEKDHFDVVILTMPVPQLLLLEGTIKSELNADLVDNLKSVTYSSRYVLILFFLDQINEQWGAQYIDKDPIFRYVSIENVKRNESEGLCAVVLHTTVGYGLKHVDDNIPDVEQMLMSQVKVLFPSWPEPKSVKCHKWRYSQVINPYPGSPGCLLVSATPPLLVGGDGFVGSNFDNCVQSAKAVCEKLKEIL
uniref:Amine oxidase domain-containing protein n=1 Tax=Graphocephala atropunctata TaxID=36148 RepID=A0A1B6K8M7_9HEMI